MILPKTTLGLAVGVLVSAVVGWGLGGAQGWGAFAGFTFGATLSGLSVAWQAHCMRYRPERVMRAQMEGFAIKLGALGVFALTLSMVEPVANALNWRAFLLAYAAAVVIVLPLSTLDLSRLLAQARAPALGSRRTA